jgi:predicted hydrolase (HD superfamily)
MGGSGERGRSLDEGKVQNMEKITPTRHQAFELLKEYNTNPALIRHALAVESVMLHFAQVLREKDPEKWGVIGLVHDLDYERYPHAHCVKAR